MVFVIHLTGGSTNPFEVAVKRQIIFYITIKTLFYSKYLKDQQKGGVRIKTNM